MILVPLAEGFEEIEAITIIDVLRRAGLDVVTASLSDNIVIGSHNISIISDTLLGDIDVSKVDIIVLPGGMPGSRNFQNSSILVEMIKQVFSENKLLAAVCAAPIVLAKAGILNGKKATCYPGFESELDGAEYIEAPYVMDGTILTGRGPGAVMGFVLKLVEIIKDKDISEKLRSGMQVYWDELESEFQ